MTVLPNEYNKDIIIECKKELSKNHIFIYYTLKGFNYIKKNTL